MPLNSLAQTDELTPEEFAAQLRGEATAEPAELTTEQFAEAIKGGVPKRPNVLQEYAGGALEGTANLVGFGRFGVEKLSGALGIPETPILEDVEAGLRGAAQQVLPEEQRGRGGFAGTVAGALGGMSAASPGMQGGKLLPTIVFGAQNAMPLYYDVLAKTGDKTKATTGLILGFAAGQLEKYGAEKYAESLMKKLSTGKMGVAVKNYLLYVAVGGASEAVPGAAQTALTDAAQEYLTGEDLDNWARLKETLPIELLLGSGFAAVDGALSRVGHQKAPEAAPAVQAQEAHPTATEPSQAPSAAQAVQEAAPTEGAEFLGPEGPLPTLEERVAEGGAEMLGPPEAEITPEAAQEELPPEIAKQFPITLERPRATLKGKKKAKAEVPPPVVEAATEPVAPAETPALVAEEQRAPTGIKHAEVDKQIKEMGLEAIEKEDVRGREQVFGEALDIYKKDQRAGEKLTRKFEEDPTGASDTDKALLSIEAARLVKARDDAEAAYNAKPTEANKAAVEAARDDYYRAAQTFKRVGTESGRSLNAQKILVTQDFTLAAMESSARVANAGKPLSDVDLAKVKKLNEKIAATKLAHEEYLAKATAEKAALEADIKTLKSEKKQAAKEPKAERPTLSLRKKKIEAAKKRIDDILNQLGVGQRAAAGLDPQKVILTAKLAKEYVNLGYQSFAKFAEEVVAKVGEHIRPYLRTAWDEAQGERDKKNIERYKTRKRGDILRLNEKMARGETETGRRRTPIENDIEALDLQIAHEQAKAEFEKFKKQKERANRTKAQKALDIATEPLKAARALKFSFDLMPIFRQAKNFAVPDIFFNPKRLAQFSKKSLMALSLKQAHRIDAEMRNSPVYKLAEAGKVDFPTVEEDSDSWLAQKIPGIGASSRLYNTFMSLYRLSAFEGFLKGIDKPTLDDLKTAAVGVNILSGRGHPGKKFGGFVDSFGSVLSSPRLLLSNVQAMAFQPLWSGSRRVRKKIRNQYARMLVGYAALYGMAELLGTAADDDDIGVASWDLRSSDFGKIRVGEKRFDIMGGISQNVVLLVRAISGKTVSTRGKVTAIRGEDKPFKGKDALDLGKDFLRYKLSPVFSTAADLATGEQVERDKRGKPLPVTPESVVEGLFVPISIEDIYDDMRAMGVEETLALRMIGLFGAGAKDYRKQ